VTLQGFVNDIESFSCDAGFETDVDSSETMTWKCSMGSSGTPVWTSADGTGCYDTLCANLEVSNSDTSKAIRMFPHDVRTVTCDDGYVAGNLSSQSGTTFNVTCTPGLVFQNSSACLPVDCPLLTVANSATNTTLACDETVTVSCNPGYTSIAGNTFNVSCIGTGPETVRLADVLLCEAVECPELSISNSNADGVVLLTDESITATCDDGYVAGNTSGSTQTITCSGTTAGVSELNAPMNCTPVDCPLLTVANSATNTTLACDETVTVSCNSGYTSIAGNTFNVSCISSGPETVRLANVLRCEAVACPKLTVNNSDTTGAVHLTTQMRTVHCDDGYADDMGNTTFEVSCVGTAPNVAQWVGVKTCDVVSCPSLTVSQSDATSVNLTTTDAILVNCASGYTSNNPNNPDGNQFTVSCQGKTPGNSDLIDVLACEAVTCPSLTVNHSDTIEFVTVTEGTRTVACDAGYKIASSNAVTFTTTCQAQSPGISDWVGVEDCVAVSCPTLPIAHSDAPFNQGAVLAADEDDVVYCDSGYTSLQGVNFTVYCTGDSPGVSKWTNVLACNAVECPVLTVNHSDTEAIVLTTTESRLITCDDGYRTPQGDTSFTASCDAVTPGVSDWSGITTCEPVACTELTVIDSINMENGSVIYTDESIEVNCAAGMSSLKGVNFTVNCNGIALGTVALHDVLACDEVACPDLTDDKSDIFEHFGVTRDSVIVNCDAGYFTNPAPDQIVTQHLNKHGGDLLTISYNATCHGIIPGVSAWDDVPCEPVVCPTVAVPQSDVVSLEGYITTDEVTITCMNGTSTVLGDIEFTVDCFGTIPGENSWNYPTIFGCYEVPRPFDVIYLPLEFSLLEINYTSWTDSLRRFRADILEDLELFFGTALQLEWVDGIVGNATHDPVGVHIQAQILGFADLTEAGQFFSKYQGDVWEWDRPLEINIPFREDLGNTSLARLGHPEASYASRTVFSMVALLMCMIGSSFF